MKEAIKNPSTIDEYIEGFPVEIKEKLIKLRAVIRKAAPKAVEGISYQMPVFKQDGFLVFFAAFKNHISFFALPSAIKKFSKELKVFKTSKSSVHFPFDEKIPLKLVTEMVKFRVKENREKAAARKKK